MCYNIAIQRFLDYKLCRDKKVVETHYYTTWDILWVILGYIESLTLFGVGYRMIYMRMKCRP